MPNQIELLANPLERCKKLLKQYKNLYERLCRELENEKNVLSGIHDTINFSVKSNPQFKEAVSYLTSETTIQGFFVILQCFMLEENLGNVLESKPGC